MVVQGKSRIHQDRLPLSLTAKFHRHATCLRAIRARHRSTRSARCGKHYSVFERAPPPQHSEPRRVQEKLSLLATIGTNLYESSWFKRLRETFPPDTTRTTRSPSLFKFSGFERTASGADPDGSGKM